MHGAGVHSVGCASPGGAKVAKSEVNEVGILIPSTMLKVVHEISKW